MLGVVCPDVEITGGGVLCLVLPEIFEGFDEDMLNWTCGVVSVLVRRA